VIIALLATGGMMQTVIGRSAMCFGAS